MITQKNKTRRVLCGMGLMGALLIGTLSGCGGTKIVENPKAQDPNATVQEMLLGSWHDRITDETITLRDDGTYRGSKNSRGEYEVFSDSEITLDEDHKNKISFFVKGDFLCFYKDTKRNVTPPDYCVREEGTQVKKSDVVGKWTAYADPDQTQVDGTVRFRKDGTCKATGKKMPSGSFKMSVNDDGNSIMTFSSKRETEMVAAAGDLVWIDPKGKEIYFLVREESKK